MRSPKVFELNNRVKTPRIGLGVLFAKNDSEVEDAVLSALSIGYRKIDTASAYGNEWGVGQGVKKSGIPRQDVFITTKVWNTDQGYDSTLKAFDKSLKELQTDYVDMYLIHWPVRTKYKETYSAMERIYQTGKAKAIGVCNFNREQLQDLMEHSNIVPALNQIEIHPYLSQNALLQFCMQHHIQLEAWRPIMMGKVVNIPELSEIGRVHHKSEAQVALRWLIQKGIAVIPKSVKPARIRENFEIFDFELSPLEMLAIENLNQNKSLGEDLSHIF